MWKIPVSQHYAVKLVRMSYLVWIVWEISSNLKGMMQCRLWHIQILPVLVVSQIAKIILISRNSFFLLLDLISTTYLLLHTTLSNSFWVFPELLFICSWISINRDRQRVKILNQWMNIITMVIILMTVGDKTKNPSLNIIITPPPSVYTNRWFSLM